MECTDMKCGDFPHFRNGHWTGGGDCNWRIDWSDCCHRYNHSGCQKNGPVLVSTKQQNFLQFKIYLYI